MNRQQIAHIPPPPDPLRPPETDLERVTWTYVPPPTAGKSYSSAPGVELVIEEAIP